MSEVTEEQRRRQLLQQRLGGQEGDFIVKRLGSNSDTGSLLSLLLAYSPRLT